MYFQLSNKPWSDWLIVFSQPNRPPNETKTVAEKKHDPKKDNAIQETFNGNYYCEQAPIPGQLVAK